MPVFTPALDLFSDLRAFRKSTVTNARIAAALTAVLESEYPPGVDNDAEVMPFKKVPIDAGMMTQLPHGMKISGFDPKHPSTTYDMFTTVCLGEACRPLSYPLNLALGSSQKFNFSSSKLDHVNYRNGLKVERNRCNLTALRPIFREWFDEAVMVPGYLPKNAAYETTPHEWHWPGFASLDPVADAEADHARLAAGTLTFRQFWAERGYDWKDMMTQLEREQAEIERLGIEIGEPVKRSLSEALAAPETEAANVA